MARRKSYRAVRATEYWRRRLLNTQNRSPDAHLRHSLLPDWPYFASLSAGKNATGGEGGASGVT
ncbi:hypothetical protein KCP74_08415 [Salmonella enterica subsp. enterica]|nr:hypothetical protein KCP74_08415 [Salmonella enterica subsp. enterica]